MTHARDVVFLHGASGPEDAAMWLAPLNVRLAQMGHSRFDGDHDRITSPPTSENSCSAGLARSLPAHGQKAVRATNARGCDISSAKRKSPGRGGTGRGLVLPLILPGCRTTW
jgi:hypothetical protein